MRVTIGDYVYDSDDVQITLTLSRDEVKRIASINLDENTYTLTYELADTDEGED
jgi:hypothetical protein